MRGAMSGSYDAIVIGAGVIGAATTLGLTRKGLRALSVYRLPAAEYGLHLFRVRDHPVLLLDRGRPRARLG
jgi:glycine/D-amino acid oxidase-like deaminating enzyme